MRHRRKRKWKRRETLQMTSFKKFTRSPLEKKARLVMTISSNLSSQLDEATIYATVSLLCNTCVVLILSIVEFRDGHPIDGTSAELRHTVSNIAYALPIIPYVTRRHKPPGIGTAAEGRSLVIVTYALLLGTLSCIHHTFSYRTDPDVYKDGTLILLWRSLDWSFSRMATPVALFNMLSPNALANVTTYSRAEGWRFRALIETLSGVAFFVLVLIDASFISSEPFSNRGVMATIATSCITLMCLLSLCLSFNFWKGMSALNAHFFGCSSALIKTINFLVCIVASALTRVEGDDPGGWVHLIWHCSTASTLAAAVLLVFDETRHVPVPFTAAAIV